ncbi:MAG: 3-hydroxyacyl-CoA dehydrogenase NAD-binding domain-containing protein, partial [Acidobacteriota bacterium]
SASENAPLQMTIEDGLAWLTFDCPGEKVNKLSSAVMASLSSLLDELRGRKDIAGAIITSAKDGIFIAGADIHEIRDVATREEGARASRLGQEIFGQIEKLPFPVVAAVSGVCLGGGTELALACHGRLGTDHPRFQMGLPEVNLGIIPGWGGTTRLPRLVGLQRGLELILTGRSVDASKARRYGLVDEAVPHQEVRRHAAALVRKLGREGRSRAGKRRRPPGLANWLLEGNPLGRALVFRQARKTVLSRTKGRYPAPLKALEVVRRAWSQPFEKALALEAEALGELVPSAISKNLIHLFFLSEKAKKDPGVDGDVGPPKEVRWAGLLGAGTMGGGIAWLLSDRDLPVRVKDVDPKFLGAGLKTARRIHEQRKKRRRMTAWELEKKMSLISPTLNWTGFGRVDVVLEAIVEDLEVKKKVLRELEPVVPKDSLIGTNTSTLPITKLQSALARPERMAGFHFFNPVERMPLIEVIRGQATSDETVAAFVALARRLGKTPVVVADGPGFLVNRILGPYLNEACHLLLETADLEGIDRALLDFGMPMGPLRLLDEVGIDVAEKAGKVLGAAYGERAAPAGVIEKLASAGRLGKKTGRGLYVHAGKKPKPDPAVVSLLGIDTRQPAKGEEVVERSVYVMIAEAARCLEEKVVRSPGELDLAMVMGIGFPPFRGGLLRHADSLGLSSVVDGLRRWRDKLGLRFAPPEALIERARSNVGFYR